MNIRDNNESKSGVHESLRGINKLDISCCRRLWLIVVRLLEVLILLCVLFTLVTEMEDKRTGDTSIKKCSQCDLVLSKTSRAFHMARHVQRVHGSDGKKEASETSSSSETLSSPKTGDKPRAAGKLNVRSEQTVKKICQGPLIQRNPEKLFRTASEAKNAPEPVESPTVPVVKKSKGEEPLKKEKSTTRETVKETKTADGPRRPTRSVLYDGAPRVIVTKEHPRKVLRNFMKTREEVQGKSDQIKTIKDPEANTELLNWDQIGQEVGYLARLCKNIGESKTPRKLYQIGRSECPHLKEAVIKNLVDAQFPMRQDPRKPMTTSTMLSRESTENVGCQEEARQEASTKEGDQKQEGD